MRLLGSCTDSGSGQCSGQPEHNDAELDTKRYHTDAERNDSDSKCDYADAERDHEHTDYGFAQRNHQFTGY